MGIQADGILTLLPYRTPADPQGDIYVGPRHGGLGSRSRSIRHEASIDCPLRAGSNCDLLSPAMRCFEARLPISRALSLYTTGVKVLMARVILFLALLAGAIVLDVAYQCLDVSSAASLNIGRGIVVIGMVYAFAVSYKNRPRKTQSNSGR